jgi:hypothetical protein
MKKNFFLIFLLIFCFDFAQVNIEAIKKNVLENPQKYYFDYLETYKTNPDQLSQDELNYIYYGNNYVDYSYKRADFNKKIEEISKFARRKISPKFAREILPKALDLYQLNPLYKDLLLDLVNIYDCLKDKENSQLYSKQYELLLQTIQNSGTGKLDTSPIIVTGFSDKFIALQHFSNLTWAGLDFKTKVLEDGSWLDIFKNGMDLYFIRTVNHKDMLKDD